MTFIANYLATTLPNQMEVNDLNHEVQVENQLGHLSRSLESISAGAMVGASFAQPIAMGSAGAPPFANPDGGSISSLQKGSSASLGFGIVSSQYHPLTGSPENLAPPENCTYNAPPPNTTTITCNGASKSLVIFNFAGNESNISFGLHGKGGASFLVNFTTNDSTITVDATGGAYNVVNVFGDGNTGSIGATGGGNLNLTIVGNDNNISLKGLGQSSYLRVLVVGNRDTVSLSSSGHGTALAVVWGGYDTIDPTGGGSPYTVYFNSFDPENPTSPLCPYDLPLTDKVSGKGPGGTLTYNNTGRNLTEANSPNAPFPSWTTLYRTPTLSGCIFFPPFPAGGQSVVAGAFVVHLLNTYAPGAEVAFDQGAVVYAQPGAYPILVDPPPITFSHGIATVWLPAFLRPVNSEAGIGTAIVSTHLVSAQRLTFPSGGWYPNSSQPVTLVYETPYGFAWNHSSFADSLRASGATIGCTPEPSVACDGPYEPGGPLGTVTIRLPAMMLTLDLAVFSVTLQ